MKDGTVKENRRSDSADPQRQLDFLLREAVAEQSLLHATFSQPRRKDDAQSRKVTVRPVLLKSGLRYQFERQVGNKALHENRPPEEAVTEMLRLLAEDYRQGLIKTPQADLQILVSKKGKTTLLRQPPSAKGDRLTPPGHNRTKSYLLPEGEPVPFLVELGVMTPEGRVVKAKYDKFRQINRFLEMVADVSVHLPKDREIRIVDFGCGKSYLTFALYHLLAVKEKRNVRIVGLDLKAEVIEACSRLAERLGWDRLSFAVGDIARYEGENQVDMVVTLHACDTATDAALLKAIGWNAQVILSVPCCQHELFGQLSQPLLKPLLKHGILKERFASLVTDAVRAQLLELAGYRTQLLEFIDLEHTPKNLLIRAVRLENAPGRDAARERELLREYAAFRDFLHLSPYMEKMAEGRLADRLAEK